jgi:hypothetical protein
VHILPGKFLSGKVFRLQGIIDFLSIQSVFCCSLPAHLHKESVKRHSEVEAYSFTVSRINTSLNFKFSLPYQVIDLE